MHSSIYTGWIRHRRHAPTPHEFRYRLFMMYLDLDELPSLFDRFWCWSSQRPAFARFDRADYHGDSSQPLAVAIRETVSQATGRSIDGPIRLLTHLRYFGHSFNPVTFYYCFDRHDTRVETIVAEITNTPWKERHAYVLPVDAAKQTGRTMHFAFDKTFHVSPFMPMDVRYDWRFSNPSDRLLVHMKNFREGRRAFDATLTLTREEIAHASLARALIQFPLMTVKVTSAIYAQALRLWLKRIPVFTHPAKSSPAPSLPHQSQ
jgi:uncharacterized protein